MQAIKAMSSMLAMAMILVAAGCQTGPRTVTALNPELNLSVSDRQILSGNSTTIFAETANLLGREANIQWSTTLGEVTPIRNGAAARFTSDQPGTAVVTAELNVDGQVIRDTANVTVNALE